MQTAASAVALSASHKAMRSETVRARARAWKALQQRQYFKVIAGASLSDGDTVADLAWVYAQAGAHALDIGPHPALLTRVEQAYAQLPLGVPRPLVMVSLDLDGDPHFRKVTVDEQTCIVCHACVPECPTEALSVTTSPQRLVVNAPLCYGCARCLPVCPTEAFTLVPLPQLAEPLQQMLSHPVVGAVELHTHTLELAALERAFQAYGTLLQDKLVSLCFRLPHDNPHTIWPYLQAFARLLADCPVAGAMLQVDGQPMSGTPEPEASCAALNSAAWLLQHSQPVGGCQPCPWPVTISGGINGHTAAWLKQAPYSALAGVGMGTVARRWIKGASNPVTLAQQLVSQFVCKATPV